MSNWNNVEERLRSWAPRAPSPKVKDRLFGQPAAPAAAALLEETPVHPAAWHWVAPAMAVFVFGLFLSGRAPVDLGPAPALLAQSALAEPARAAYYADAHHSGNNAVQVMTFDWTNAGHSLTTTVPVAGTNRLRL